MAINLKASLQEILSHSFPVRFTYSVLISDGINSFQNQNMHVPKSKGYFLCQQELSKCYVSLVLNFILFIWRQLSSALSLPALTPHSQAMHCRQQTINQKGKKYPFCVLTKKDEGAFAAAASHCCLSDVTHWQEFKCETSLILQHVLLDHVPWEVKKKTQQIHSQILLGFTVLFQKA